jgi:glycosyltransferase involved in cell wall biosynthesis
MSNSTSKAARYVCVINRNRDGYEVPLALEESGQLECFVTDFYAHPRWAKFLPGFLARRQKAGLPAAKTKMALASFVVQYAAEALRRPMQRVFQLSDRLLGQAAARRAVAKGAGLYAYSSYLNARPNLAAGAQVIDFEYHPHPDLAIKVLREDFARFPQVAWSMDLEEKAHQRDTANQAWRFADAVVCASAMTRRALEHCGCPPERITVIPYGITPAATPALPRAAGPCRFLYVGQGLSRKGLHHLAAAWQQAAPAHAELIVVSYRIDPGIAPMLDQAGITVLGRQSREDLDALFASADVFIMPSLIEGFGLVYLEALQTGCHVVGTVNTGLPDLNLSPEAATVLPVGDISAIAASITALAARKSAQGFDAAAIQAEGNRWTWAHFRAAISAHATELAAKAPAA